MEGCGREWRAAGLVCAARGSTVCVCNKRETQSQSTYKIGGLYLAKNRFHGNADKLVKIFVYGKYTDSSVPFD